MLVTKRQISLSSGTEGPSHDPYHVEIIRISINDDQVYVRLGSLSGCTLERNGNTILKNVWDEDGLKLADAMLFEMTNMRLDEVEKYHQRWLARNPEIAEMMRIDRQMRSWM